MTEPAVYVLDANVFIQASRAYYAFDLAPAFWQALIEHAKNGRVRSIDRVMEEIDRGKDDLTTWAGDTFHEWFASTDQGDVFDVYRRIMAWAQG